MKALFAFFPLILTACSSIPPSYLPTSTTPITNIEAGVVDVVDVEAGSSSFELTNRTERTQKLQYMLFWYDKQGVTQGELTPTWQRLSLAPNARATVALQKPTIESSSYHLYLGAQ